LYIYFIELNKASSWRPLHIPWCINTCIILYSYHIGDHSKRKEQNTRQTRRQAGL